MSINMIFLWDCLSRCQPLKDFKEAMGLRGFGNKSFRPANPMECVVLFAYEYLKKDGVDVEFFAADQDAAIQTYNSIVKTAEKKEDEEQIEM